MAKKKDLFVSRLKAKFGPDEPIFTFEIAKTFPNISLVRVHQLLNEAEAAGDIRRFQQGIHYIPSEKSSKLDVNRIIVKKYVTDGKEIFGISYGFLGYLPSLFRDPHYREEQVYCNDEGRKMREVAVGTRRFIIRQTRVRIDKSNYLAYAFLEFLCHVRSLTSKSKAEGFAFLSAHPLSKAEVFSLAAYFPARAMKNLLLGDFIDSLS